MMKKMITKEEMNRIETVFKERCIALNIKFGSKAFYKEQSAFFVGAMIALDNIVPYWALIIPTGREIIEPYKLK